MSYAIGHVIYGFPLNDRHRDILDAWDEEKILDPETGETRPMTDEELMELDCQDEDGGFETFYSGNGPSRVGFCGVELDTIDECGDVHLDAMKWQATPEQKKKALEKINELDKSLRDAAQVVGHYIVWGSS
jgi:hypothetical protein